MEFVCIKCIVPGYLREKIIWRAGKDTLFWREKIEDILGDVRHLPVPEFSTSSHSIPKRRFGANTNATPTNNTYRCNADAIECNATLPIIFKAKDQRRRRRRQDNIVAAMDEKKSDDDHHDAANGAILPLLSPSKVEPNFEAPYGPTVHISKHPVLKHKLSILRSSSTKPAAFRTVLREITFHLAYEATATLTTRDIPITVPSAKVQLNGSGGGDHHLDAIGQKIKEKVALIPILRSGLGMVDPMLELIDNATVHHIGMYRNSKSLMPVQYYNRLPKICDVDVAYILDPLIATSATVISVVGMMKKVS